VRIKVRIKMNPSRRHPQAGCGEQGSTPTQPGTPSRGTAQAGSWSLPATSPRARRWRGGSASPRGSSSMTSTSAKIKQ